MFVRLATLLVILFVSACAQRNVPSSAFCEIDSPNDRPPDTISRIHRGQTKTEVESVLGEPDYSPTEGVYYHSTGGDCEFGELRSRVPCGYVVSYRSVHSDSTKGMTEKGVLAGCSWGGIAE
jgi:hypothetical protein